MHRLVTVGYVTVVAAAGWAVNHASEARSDQKLRALENTCDRTGNPGRALDRLASSGGVRVLRVRLQPILDCHRTYVDGDGRPVPLRLLEQARYVEAIGRGVIPVVRDGVVTE